MPVEQGTEDTQHTIFKNSIFEFNASDKNTSSTYRELLAVNSVLQSIINDLKHQTVLWFTDNQNVSRIIQAGSSKLHLQKLCIDIYNLCVKNDISIKPQWIPREQNQLADTFSKELDSDNWSIDNETFEYIQTNLGRFTIDRFADNENKKVQKFNSKNKCPNTSAVNAFTENWDKEFNWLCPPISMIGSTIAHAKLCKAKGVLFVPLWKSAYYWPLLTNDGKYFNHNIILVIGSVFYM